jgi:hypothetical protein
VRERVIERERERVRESVRVREGKGGGEGAEVGSTHHEDALVAALERLVVLEALLLRHLAVDGDGREVALHQQLVQLYGARHRLDEDHHLYAGAPSFRKTVISI